MLATSQSAETLNGLYGNYNFTVNAANFTISAAEFEVADITNTVYNGEDQAKAPVVTFGETTLVENTDYTVSYSEDVKNVGEVTVTVTGIGNFTGNVEKTYQITKKPVTIAAKGASKTYGDADPTFENATITEYYNGELDGISLTVSRTNTDEAADTYTGVLATSQSAETLNGLYGNYNFTVNAANFTINPLKVEHYEEGLDGEYVLYETEILTGKTDPTEKAAEKNYTGFTYDKTEERTEDGSLVKELYYTRNSYEVEYAYTNAPEGASAKPQTKSYKYGETVTVAPKADDITGYTVSDWKPNGTFEMPAEKVTITANWTINRYTITFNSNGGSTVPSITQDYGTTVTVPDDPTREGYTFEGWDPTIPGTMPAENKTLTAKWTPKSYTVIYMVDGVEDSRETVTYLTHVTLKQAPTKNGFTFSGWMNEEGRAAADFDMPARDVTISGTFTENEKVATKYGLKVTYKTSNGDVVDTFSKEDYSEGDKATATRKIPDGYTASIRRVSNADLTNPVNTVDKETKLTTISGTIGTASVEYEVTYSPALYTLTINFQVYGEDDEIATITRQYYGGAEYSILNSDGDIPWTELPRGYRIVEVNKKVMPNGDYEITVFVVGENDDTVTFPEDPTPLGINNATLGTGEIIE